MEKKEKTGGRTKGTPNHTTKEIRNLYQSLVSENIKLLNDDIKQLEPFQRLKIIIELSKFVLPSLKPTELGHKYIIGGKVFFSETEINFDEVTI